MNEIICPHCGKAFKIDEAGYADILKQVRNRDFDQQLHERLALAEKEKIQDLEIAKQKLSAVKDAEIQEWKAKVDAGEVSRKLAVAEALNQVEKERDALATELAQTRKEAEAASKLADVHRMKELQETSNQKDKELQTLQAKLDAAELARSLAVNEAVQKVEKERPPTKDQRCPAGIRAEPATGQ